MTDSTNTAELSAEEQAYFESGGESGFKEAPATEQPTQEQPADGLQAETEQTAPEGVNNGETQPRDDKGKFVPHQALHAEREEHKKTKAQLEEIARKQAVLEDRWNTLLTVKQQQEQPAEETPPDPNEDIFAAFAYQQKKFNELQTQIQEREQQQTQATQAQQEEQALWNEWSVSAQQFATTTPDFGDSVKYLSEMRDKQLQALSIANPQFANPAGRNAQINAELKQIVQAAKQQGMSPAEAVYQISKGYGFTGAQPAPQPGQQPNTQMPDNLARIEEAMAASRSVAQSPGGSGGGQMTPQQIADMAPAEFDRWIGDPKNERLFNELMGG